MPLTIGVADLGGELRRRRKDKELSLRDVEEETGISAATLSRIERGAVPDLSNVKKLADWLNVAIQAAGTESSSERTDEELIRTIEVHLRASKGISEALARSIAESFDIVMRVELAKNEGEKKA